MNVPNLSKKYPDPVADYCCGSYCSEAGCCKFEKKHPENPDQKEMFPNEVGKNPNFKNRDYPARWQVRGRSKPWT